MLKKLCLFILMLIYVNGIELKLSTGLIKGKSVRVGHQNLHMFKKVPFAHPPLGRLRFRKPQPVSNWTGTLDASEYGPSCMINITRSDHPVKLSEDCLYLNVFTSDVCLYTKKCPVFIMVHGGAFVFGNAVQYNDTQILSKYVEHEIVFILPAYRVGFFGFADFGEDYEDSPYNVGLYDLIAALNWTQREISSFGGDPKRTTLFGYSSGADMVQYLMASPKLQSHKLFTQAIISSGLPIMSPNLNRNITEKFLEINECSYNETSNDTLSIEDKLECLRGKTAEELNVKTGLLKPWWGHLGVQSSKDLLPARSYMALAERRTPIPLLVITAKDEMGLLYEPDDSIEHVCQENLLIFDYIQNATIKACSKRYNNTYLLTRDTYHAIAVRECQINSRLIDWSSLPAVNNFVETVGTVDGVKAGGIHKADRNTIAQSSNQAMNDVKVEGVARNIVKRAYEMNELVDIKSENPAGKLTHYAHTRDELLNTTAHVSTENDVRMAGAVRNLDNVLPKIGIQGILEIVNAVNNNKTGNETDNETDNETNRVRNAKDRESIGSESPIANVTKWAQQAKEGKTVEVQGVKTNDSAQVNSKHPCYVGIFAQINRSAHADDIMYMLGQHLSKIDEFTANDKLMDKFYPQLIRNFIFERPPTEDWLPTNAKGENYYLLNFNVQSENVLEREWPHLVENDTYNSKHVDFYLKYLNAVEQNASQFNPEHRNPLIFGQNFVVNETGKGLDEKHTDQINEYERLYGYTSLWTISLLLIMLLVFAVAFSVKKSRPNDAYWTEDPPIALPALSSFPTEKTKLLSH